MKRTVTLTSYLRRRLLTSFTKSDGPVATSGKPSKDLNMPLSASQTGFGEHC